MMVVNDRLSHKIKCGECNFFKGRKVFYDNGDNHYMGSRCDHAKVNERKISSSEACKKYFSPKKK